MQAVDSMRRGAASTSREIREQARAGDQVSTESQRLAGMIAGISKAMREQAESAGQVAAAADSMRTQTEQLAKAMGEQTRAIKDMSDAARNIAKQVSLITRANREHSTVSAAVLNEITEIRGITERNAQGAKDTLRRASSLIDRAQSLNSVIEGLGDDGRAGKKNKSKKRGKR
jgi:methyl-accepting chemotaxis protein